MTPGHAQGYTTQPVTTNVERSGEALCFGIEFCSEELEQEVVTLHGLSVVWLLSRMNSVACEKENSRENKQET